MTDQLRNAAQAVIDWQDDEDADDFREWEKRIEALRQALYEVPCHVDTGATRAAKSVRMIGDPIVLNYSPSPEKIVKHEKTVSAGMAYIDRLCQIMSAHGMSTGHGDTMGQVLDELEWQLKEKK